jgi:PTS system beta-glucosides-specific IIC component
MSLSAVKDDVFAKGIMGSGFAIAPTDGKVYAPFDGKVVSVFPTKHAIGLVSRNGVELLIHIGLDTVELKGKYFDTKVVNDQSVHQGELLETFDIEAIKKAGYDTTIPVIVTNTNEFKDIAVIRADGPVQAGDSVLNVVAEEKQMITSSVAVNKA